MKNLLTSLLLSFCTTIGFAQLSLFDTFDRNLSTQGITLVDWEGYLANPAIMLKVGSVKATNVTVSANCARCYFNMPNSVSALGAQKTFFIVPNSTNTFYLSIFPDRDGANETYIFTMTDGSTTVRLPIKVIDQDRPDRDLDFKILKNYSQDNSKTPFFSDTIYQKIANRAADDYAYFLADVDFDSVAAQSQTNFIWNDHFDGGRFCLNQTAYKGFELYFHGTHNAVERSGGQPSGSNFQTIGGETTPLRRSGTVSLEVHGNYNTLGWNTTWTDNEWFRASNLGENVNDFYSIVLHEIGHALGFNPEFPVFEKAKQAKTWADSALISYQGMVIPIDGSDHLSNGAETDALKLTDRISKRGAFGSEYANVMPWGRWLISKLNLLSLQALGYTLRETSPFALLDFTKTDLKNGKINTIYTDKLIAIGGIETYKWEITEGVLPRGLQLNSFNGTVSGTPLELGKFDFMVKITDQDGAILSEKLSLIVEK